MDPDTTTLSLTGTRSSFELLRQKLVSNSTFQMNPNSVYCLHMRFTPLTRFITTEVLTQQERCILYVFVITKDRIELFSSTLLSPIKVIVAQRAQPDTLHCNGSLQPSQKIVFRTTFFLFRAGEGVRSLNLRPGRPTLYQLSYTCIK